MYKSRRETLQMQKRTYWQVEYCLLDINRIAEDDARSSSKTAVMRLGIKNKSIRKSYSMGRRTFPKADIYISYAYYD